MFGKSKSQRPIPQEYEKVEAVGSKVMDPNCELDFELC